MLEKLRDLVFGFGQYEKARLDERFSLILSLISQLSLNSPQDFEHLESCIYKIKDQLRVKSSSLNRAIASSQQNLTRKDVDEILSRLTKLKENFVSEAFSRKEETQIAQEELNTEISEQKETEEQEKKEEFKEELDTLEHSLEDLNKESEKTDDDTQQEVLKTDDYEITLENRTLPVLRIQFFKEVDHHLLKYLSSLFFESFDAEGSNILITGNEALIVLRRQGDEMFSLPRIQCDLEQVFTQLKKEESNDIQEGEYKEIEEPKEEKILSRKEEDSSLDSLLGSFEEKDAPHDPVESHNPEKEERDEEPEFEKSSEIELERKEGDLESQGIEKVEEKQENEEEEKTYLIYKDEQIKVYLNDESPVLGELIIESIPKKTQEELSETEMSYMFVFSKIFASILFESLEAHGTNIIWERSSSEMRILPRYQEDGINLQWKGQQHKDSFLEQIKSKIHATLAQGVDKEQIKTQQASSQGQAQKVQGQSSQEASISTGVKSGVPKFEELFTPERIDNTKKEKLEFLKKCIMSMP